ncbi:MAG: RND transporter [Shimia thalassica]|uniref:RND transporter n=1 Tax=Shimia thalassica TaxID=1715693 RepID=UPI0032998556
MRALDSVSWTIVIILALTLGLAPFTPEPHIWEKLKMLAAGELVRAVDWFDLLLHGVPWVVLGLKAVRTLRPDA